MKKKKLYFLILALVVVLALGFWLNYRYFPRQAPSPEIYPPTASPSVALSPSPATSPSPTSTPIPGSYTISNFPFEPQAPLGNWDALHEESCEEASLILVNYYYKHQNISAQMMEDEIQKVVSWEGQNGYSQDVTVAELGQVAKDYYHLGNTKVLKNITIDKIKNEIAAGHPVIVPAAGRLLGNPYFTAPGPVYHMVVAIGYTPQTIIVQDVGTKRGDHYVYSQRVFYNAIHDWAGSKDNIESGGKSALVFL